MAVIAVQAEQQSGVGGAGLLHAVSGQTQAIGQGGVDQGLGGGAGHRAGHIGDAVVDHAVNGEHRIFVRRGA